ncbi:PNGase F N-terminal domain-containing protein [Yeosuana sp. MJ-SS3]|uniref:PNGase F N-terminal domain-containing protein n=1 Tax=Gilvirhabdus luticola TaxID=3079858 RepID=A0ABU3U6J7_9FLAO|nr:PNGase F N-terminal domain-containing protein [Yeosuana sp. MJ-SS3]MDU8886029.1 PNGase F N-terminal domain-containing protein [Yeosuana sp. MJ-SS3]
MIKRIFKLILKQIKDVFFFFLFATFCYTVNAQNEVFSEVFKNQLINFGGEIGTDPEANRLQNGRIIYKKITVPEFPNGTDVTLKLTVRSNGDRWDKSGSCFVVTDHNQISVINVSKGEKQFPDGSCIEEKFKGVKATKNYKPALELLRFMTPFGVGHYSNETGKHRKPVYIPSWEKEVVWEKDISNLTKEVTGTFYVGVWIDTWTKEGYSVDLSFTYSNRPLKSVNILPLVNTIPYVEGQSLPDFFAITSLESTFKFDNDVKNVKLFYITTGHGGHSGGDEFIKIRNKVFINNELKLDTIPWRDDCASFRRFNPTSGVWLKKDSASYIDFEAQTYKIKMIEERIASSDLSRSNWCPGSSVDPYIVDLGDFTSGEHSIKITIPATLASEDKFNHWLVSAYLTYEN